MTTATRDAHKEAITRPLQEIAAELQEALGQRLVAYAAGVRSPKLVGRWATGTVDKPRDETEARVRLLYRVKRTLGECYDDRTIRAFLVSANPDMRDQTPIDAIRDGHGIDAVRAAQAFLN